MSGSRLRVQVGPRRVSQQAEGPFPFTSPVRGKERPGLSLGGLCSGLQALDLCSGKPGPGASRREPCPADTGSLSPSQQGKVTELVSSLVGDQAESAVPASHLVLEMPPPPPNSQRERAGTRAWPGAWGSLRNQQLLHHSGQRPSAYPETWRGYLGPKLRLS